MSPVAEPLTVADLAALDAAYLHRWRYRWPRFVALSGGMVLALLTLIAFTADARPCLPESPCGPDRAGSILLGVMYGVALLSLIYRRWAAAAAVTIAAVLPWYDHSQPDIALALWLYLLAGAHVIGCLVLARIADPRWHPAVRRWRAGRTDLRTPAKPARRVRPPFGHAWAGVGLLAGALAGARWIEVHQARVGRQEAIAGKVTAMVRGTWDDDAVLLALPDGSTGTAVVEDPARYPIELPVEVAVDDAGLLQLLAEPYDVTEAYLVVAIVAVGGVALLLRFATRAAGQRWFFRRPQPTSAVWIRRGGDTVLCYPAEFDDEAPPVGEVRVRDRPVGTNGSRPVRAVLHGTPVHGRWCTVTVDGRTLSPTHPMALVAPDDELLLGALDEDDTGPAPSALEALGRQRDVRTSVAVHWAILLACCGAAAWVGDAFRAPLLAWLSDPFCAVDSCNRPALAGAGWATLALPAMVCCAAMLVVGETAVTFRLALLGVPLVIALGQVMYLGDSVQWYAYLDANPDLDAVFVGFTGALAVLLVGTLVLPMAVERIGRWRVARGGGAGATPVRLCSLAILGGQLVVLVAVLYRVAGTA